MHRLVEHIRGNVISYLALFCALGGTGYAAVGIPNNSVGTGSCAMVGSPPASSMQS